MTDIPPFHVCHSLSSENGVLKSKYEKLKRKYKELYHEMLGMKENIMRLEMEKECHVRGKAEVALAQVFPNSNLDTGKKKESCTNEKLVTLNSKLIKQFEKGNKQHKCTERKLVKAENENEKLKGELFDANQQIEFLKKQLVSKDDNFQLLSSKMKTLNESKQGYSTQVSALNKEKKMLLAKNKKLKDELNGLDDSFFEEIEDMKYALQQSAKLNTEYERTLRRVCKQFGLNYSTALNDTDCKFKRREKSRRFATGE